MIRLRHAVPDDLEQLLKWRNDPFIYSRFNNAKPVTLEEHTRWFNGAIMNSHIRLFIIELVSDLHETPCTPIGSAFPIGQIRFDREPAEYRCQVSISLPEIHTGKGYGPEAIRQGSARIDRNVWPGIEIIANFVPNNCPSKSAFRKAGFVTKDEKSTTMVYRP